MSPAIIAARVRSDRLRHPVLSLMFAMCVSIVLVERSSSLATSITVAPRDRSRQISTWRGVQGFNLGFVLSNDLSRDGSSDMARSKSLKKSASISLSGFS